MSTSMGNITTTMMLDHEAIASHTVIITATDSDDATDDASTVTVNGRQRRNRAATASADSIGLTNDCEALLDAKGDLGGDAELGCRHRHGRMGRRVDGRRPDAGYGPGPGGCGP